MKPTQRAGGRSGARSQPQPPLCLPPPRGPPFSTAMASAPGGRSLSSGSSTRPEFYGVQSFSPLVRPLCCPGFKCPLTSAQGSRCEAGGGGRVLNLSLSVGLGASGGGARPGASARGPILTSGLWVTGLQSPCLPLPPVRAAPSEARDPRPQPSHPPEAAVGRCVAECSLLTD